MSRKVVFLDRDGTIIEDKIYLNDPENVVYLEGAIEGMKKLFQAGYEFVVVTNQSGVPRGLVQESNIHKIHEKISADLKTAGVEVLAYYYAPHLPESNHPLRKPNTGMLDLANQEHQIDFSKSWMIGDRMTDVEAGTKAGCRCIFLRGTEELSSSDTLSPEYICDNLMDSALIILGH